MCQFSTTSCGAFKRPIIFSCSFFLFPKCCRINQATEAGRFPDHLAFTSIQATQSESTISPVTYGLQQILSGRLVWTRPHLPSLISHSNNLHVTSRHTPPYAPLLNLCPPISWVFLDQDEPLPLLHAMFFAALRRVLVQRLYIFELFGAPPRRYRRALLLRRGRPSDGRAAVRVRARGADRGGACMLRGKRQEFEI